MKVVVLLLVLAGLFFVLGARRSRSRSADAAPPPAAPTPAAGPTTMLRCAQCGVHLPADDALPGKGGVFCSAAHRASFEARDQA